MAKAKLHKKVAEALARIKHIKRSGKRFKLEFLVYIEMSRDRVPCAEYLKTLSKTQMTQLLANL